MASSSRIVRADDAAPDVIPDASALCARAVAYLKRGVAADPLAIEALVPVTREFGFGLVSAYIVDLGNRYEFVEHRHLTKAGVTIEALHATGLANLNALVGGMLNIKHLDAVYAIQTGTEFDASTLLLDELWDKTLTPYTPYGTAVVIPNQNTAVFCDRSLDAALQDLRAISDAVTKKNGDHLLIPDLLLRHKGKWEILQG